MQNLATIPTGIVSSPTHRSPQAEQDDLVILLEAVAQFELSMDARIVEQGSFRGEFIEICSGGLRSDARMPFPALWASPELAVRSWLRSAEDFIGRMMVTTMSWKKRPELFGFQMTEMESKTGCQRLALPRWTVLSNVEFAT